MTSQNSAGRIQVFPIVNPDRFVQQSANYKAVVRGHAIDAVGTLNLTPDFLVLEVIPEKSAS